MAPATPALHLERGSIAKLLDECARSAIRHNMVLVTSDPNTGESALASALLDAGGHASQSASLHPVKSVVHPGTRGSDVTAVQFPRVRRHGMADSAGTSLHYYVIP